jgi:hypothetical protein
VANVAVLLVVALASWFVVSVVRRRRHGLVAERGTGIGADLGVLSDAPRVTVKTVTAIGADRARVVLRRETPAVVDGGTKTGAAEGTADPSGDLDMVVHLRPEDSGFALLQGWQEAGMALALVIPPQSRIVRLRSIDDLQPLTLRRVDVP